MHSSERTAALIHLPLIDSTNNYAMQLLDVEAAGAGLTILADAQSSGKGQRGNVWIDQPGDSLLMSTILQPGLDISSRFAFSAAIAVTVAELLMDMFEHWHVHIKWPNDIIINDRKAGGILIENVLRGSSWLWSVTGIGINVRQLAFPPGLPFATSLKLASGKDFEIVTLAKTISTALLSIKKQDVAEHNYLHKYNDYLYKRNQLQTFNTGSDEVLATVLGVTGDGLLKVKLPDGSMASYVHGEQEWKWR